LNYSLVFSIIIPVMFFVGWGYEKIVVSPLRKRPNWMINVMITTLASAIVLDNVALIVFGPHAKTLPLIIDKKITFRRFTVGADDAAILVFLR
jgi:branched-subunit amino acid ABC-type transport system permease component